MTAETKTSRNKKLRNEELARKINKEKITDNPISVNFSFAEVFQNVCIVFDNN